jgi:uncharacterized protein (TIGR00369 family)
MSVLTEQRRTEIMEAIAGVACIDSLGIRVLALDDGAARISGRHDRDFDGIGGTFHGGLLATIADCAAWFAIATQTGPAERMLTTDLNIHYHNPGIGDVTAEARVIKLGRTLCPVQVELFDVAGALVATSRVCYIRLSSTP